MNKEFEKYYGKYDIHDLVDEFNSVLPTMRQLIKYSEFKTILVEVAKQKELIDKIKETIRENTIDYALAIDVIIEINDLIKEYEDDSKTNV